MAWNKRTVDTKAVNSATEVLTQIAQLATVRLDDAKWAQVVGDPTNDGLCPVQIYGDDPSRIVQVMNATPYIPAKGDDCYVYCVDNNLSSATAFIIQIRGKDGNSLQKLFANQINEALANWTAPTSNTPSASGPSIVDTWRPININGAPWKTNSTTSGPFNFVPGSNITLSASGNSLTISAAGGGSSVTLNGAPSAAPSFYAPTGGGTSGQILLAGGANTAPSWNNTIPITALALPAQVGQADEGKVPTIVGVASSEWEVQWATPPAATITPKLGTTGYYIKAENGNEINFYSTALSLPNGRIQFDGPQAPLVGDRKHVADFIFGQVVSPVGATSGAYYTSANVHGNIGYFSDLFLTEYGSMGSTWIDVQDILYNRTLPAVTASDKGKVLAVTSGGTWAPRMQIPTGAGYTFEATTNTGGLIKGRILGTANATGVYGWHTFYVDGTDGIYQVDGDDVLDASFSNASIIVVTEIFCISYDGGTYRLYDGTLVDTDAKFTAAVNKLGYLEEDTYIQWSD